MEIVSSIENELQLKTEEAQKQSLLSLLRGKVQLAVLLAVLSGGCKATVRTVKTYTTWEPVSVEAPATERSERSRGFDTRRRWDEPTPQPREGRIVTTEEPKEPTIEAQIDGRFLKILVQRKVHVKKIKEVTEREIRHEERESRRVGKQCAEAACLGLGGLCLYGISEEGSGIAKDGSMNLTDAAVGGAIVGSAVIGSHSLYTAIKAIDKHEPTGQTRVQQTPLPSEQKIVPLAGVSVVINTPVGNFSIGETDAQGHLQLRLEQLAQMISQEKLADLLDENIFISVEGVQPLTVDLSPIISGTGTKIWANGNKYIGEFQNGKLHGQGTYIWVAEKTIYVGEWREGKVNGKGHYTWPDGREYNGEWEDGNMNGQGTFTWADGIKYAGQFTNGRFQATRALPEGGTYSGDFLNGKMDGKGTLIMSNDSSYEGQFQDGKFHGQGTYKWNTFEYYVGDFRDGKIEGKGTITKVSGESYVGDWRNGKCSNCKDVEEVRRQKERADFCSSGLFNAMICIAGETLKVTGKVVEATLNVIPPSTMSEQDYADMKAEDERKGTQQKICAAIYQACMAQCEGKSNRGLYGSDKSRCQSHCRSGKWECK